MGLRSREWRQGNGLPAEQTALGTGFYPVPLGRKERSQVPVLSHRHLGHGAGLFRFMVGGHWRLLGSVLSSWARVGRAGITLGPLASGSDGGAELAEVAPALGSHVLLAPWGSMQCLSRTPAKAE